MTQQLLTESPEKTKQQIARRETSPDFCPVISRWTPSYRPTATDVGQPECGTVDSSQAAYT